MPPTPSPTLAPTTSSPTTPAPTSLPAPTCSWQKLNFGATNGLEFKLRNRRDITQCLSVADKDGYWWLAMGSCDSSTTATWVYDHVEETVKNAFSHDYSTAYLHMGVGDSILWWNSPAKGDGYRIYSDEKGRMHTRAEDSCLFYNKNSNGNGHTGGLPTKGANCNE